MNGRVLAVDVGTRRVGLAISDASRTLARPLETIAVTSEADAVNRVAGRILELADEADGLSTIVGGMPRGLGGTPSDYTSRVGAFNTLLRARGGGPVETEDERL